MTIFMGNGNYETQILDAIQMLVDDAVSKANYDKTIKATISRCVDATIGKYVIKYQGNSFYAYSYNTDVTYSSGTAVYVLVPGNDMKQEKSIIGTVDKLGIDYVSIIEGENGYEVTGVNAINLKTTFGLCSYKTQDIQILYDRDNQVDLINLDTFGLKSYIQQSNSIICGATFRTNLPTEQRFRGDYGIVFSLDFIDNATGETVTRSYMVNIDQMTGQPYNFTTASRQYGIFEVDGSHFISVKQIYIFSYDFPNIIEGDSIEREDDIFVSKIELSAANALDSVEAGTAALTFITPKGTYFDETHLDTDSKIIEAQVRIKGQTIDNNSQNVEYYWFRENNKISTKSQAYNKYGGAGWECLNENNVIQEATNNTDALVEWVPATYQYITTKTENIAKETKYKCVAVYNNDTTLSKTIIIYNYSSDYELTIVSDDGTTFYYDLGNPTLTCKVNGVEELGNEYEYVWSSIDNNNTFKNIYETVESNTEYNDALEQYNTLIEQINSNNVLTGSIQEEVSLYKRILDQYEYIMRVEGNKIHQLKVSEITNFTTYRCSVFRSGVAIGTASIIISNNLKNESNYSVVINNGNQVFKYNENGIAPNNKSLDNPITILPLTFTVYDNEGREVSAEAIGLNNVKWIVPTENTLVIANNDQGSPSETTETTETYSGLEVFNFDINTRYNVKNDNNDIQLLINYKEKVLTARTNFTFTKTGEIGTNGTDFVCKIVPNIQSGQVAPVNPIVIYNEYLKTYKLNYDAVSANKWFKVQLWHDGEQVFEGIETGTSSENIEATVTWSILKNTYGTDIIDNSNLTIGSANGSITFDATEYENPANIIKCTINYDGVDYYSTIPVIVSRVQSEDYEILLTEQTGFKSVMYTTDGQSPVYDSEKPFDITVYQTINGVKENISLYEPETYRVDYSWIINGNVYYSDWQSSLNLTEKSVYPALKRNQKSFRPSDTYNGLCVNNAVTCIVTHGDEAIGSIHIPIHFYLNRYGNSAMNGWDGNSITFDNKGGLILAPQVGAGTKNNDNSFTGVFMGSVKEAGATKEEHGLFGYSSGERTITLNSEDGSARFGKAGLGQIVIDPASNEAIIRSGVYDEKTGVGMEINLTEPSIKFASGNFEVSADGTVTAEAFATKQSVQELEESISLFNVNLDFDTIMVPCDSNNIPLDNGGYEVFFSATYKNSVTTGYQVELVSGEYDGITTTLSDNAIVFDVYTTESIENAINVYSLKFTYTDFSTFKTYTVNKNITVALAIQGKDGYQGIDGKSAYQIWLEAGNTGTEEDYLASLQGAPGQDGAKGEDGEAGKSAYQIWLDAGNTGTEEDYLASLKGADGRSAYEIAVDEGFEGTEEDWLVSLIGKDGPQGIQGETGADGKTSYTHFAYANSADGTEDFSTTDGLNKIYLGQYSDFNEDDSIEPSDYTWSLIKGSDGPQGIQGETGIGVSSIIEQYYLSISNQNQTGGSWVETQPDWKSGYYIWTRSEITWTDGNVTHTDPILADAINKANETANTASSEASNAKDVANNASTAANEAKTEAATATSTANNASSTANSALEKATTTESGLANLTTIVDNNYSDLQKQIDGAISTWFDSHVPTNDNYPAVDWTEDELESHVGDLFYITSGSSSGQCYRYAYIDNAYQWIIVEDAEVAKALADAATAQATADGKATVYTGTTITPRSPSEGDLWLKSEDDAILTYVDGEWIEYNKYAAAAQAAQDTADAATETANTAKNTANNASSTATQAKNTADSAMTTVQTTVRSVDVQYAISTDSQTAPTTGWSTVAPTWVDGQYIWSRNVTTYVNGNTTTGEAVCITGGKGATGATGGTGAAGSDGIGITSIIEQYYLSSSSSSQTGGSWSTTQPTWKENYYFWTRSKITWTEGDPTYTDPVLASGLNSANSTANTASTNASNAVSTANTANTNASNAVSTANAASSKADTATSTANTAKTTADAAQTAASNAQTTANTANTTATAAKNAIDNLEIGGRNYFSHKTQTAFNEDGTCTLKDYQNVGSFTQFYNLTKDMSYFVGKDCYLSFDVISPNGSTPFSVYNTNGNPRYAISVSGTQSPISTSWVSQRIKVTVTDRGDSYTEAPSNKIEMYGSAQMGVQIRNVKFEIGTKPTDWTPAPEDVEAEMDNLVESTTLQYIIWDSPSLTNAPTEDKTTDADWSNSATVLSDLEANDYVWIRTKYILKSGTPKYSAPTCLLYAQKRLVEQYTEYLLWSNEKNAPGESTSYSIGGITYTWSKDKPTAKLTDYPHLWTRLCKVYKYIGETAEAEAPEYSEYHLDPSWNILFDLDKALEDAVTDITNKIGSGFARIQDGNILIGNDLTSPTKLIVMNQNGIAFFQREDNGKWPDAEELSNIGTSTWSIDGTLNMQGIRVNDLNASNIQNQNLILGATNDNGATVSGDFDLYDSNKNIMFETVLDNTKTYVEGFKIYKRKLNSTTGVLTYDGYIFLSREYGLLEYNAGGDIIYGHNGSDAFAALTARTKQLIITDKGPRESTSGEVGIQMIPMSVNNTGDSLTHVGVAFIKI